MVPRLFIAPAASAVDRALAAGSHRGPVLVLGQPRLARALAERGREVLLGVESPRGRRRPAPTFVYEEGALPVAAGSLAGLVSAGIGDRDDWHERLAEWTRVVETGGAIALLDQGAARPRATELTRRALCAGLSEIEQRAAGRTLVTSGLVTHFETEPRSTAS